MDRLIFRYEHDASFSDPKLDRDDFGFLTMSVAGARFSGEAGFWVQWQDVREFAQGLDAFPIRPMQPITAKWGFNALEGDDLILAVEIAPKDTRGNLTVRVEIADQYNQRDRVRASFATNYPDLLSFQEQIVSLMDGEIQEAVLNGH